MNDETRLPTIDDVEKVDDKTMIERMEDFWGNASLTPAIVAKLKGRPKEALKMVRLGKELEHRITHYTAIEVCAAIGSKEAYKVMQELPVGSPYEYFFNVIDLVRKSGKTIGAAINEAIPKGNRRINGWGWIAWHYLKKEAEVFRPNKMENYQACIKAFLSTAQNHIKDLNASKNERRNGAAEYMATTGCPGFIPLLQETLAREKSKKTKVCIVQAQAYCGDTSIIERALSIAMKPKADNESRRAYCRVLTQIGDVRAKAPIQSLIKDGLSTQPQWYGKTIFPYMLQLGLDPKVAKSAAYNSAISFNEHFFPPEYIYMKVDDFLSNPLSGYQLAGILPVLLWHFQDKPNEKRMTIKHAIRHIRTYDPDAQKDVIKSLISARYCMSLITECWDDLADEARVETVRLIRNEAKYADKFIFYWPEPILQFMPEGAEIIKLLLAWKNDKALASLFKAIAAAPAYFFALDDKPIIEACHEALGNKSQPLKLAALSALSELGSKGSIKVIKEMDDERPKVKEAASKALADIPGNQERRAKQKKEIHKVKTRVIRQNLIESTRSLLWRR